MACMQLFQAHYLFFYVSAMESPTPTCRAVMNNLPVELYDLYRDIFRKLAEVSYYTIYIKQDYSLEMSFEMSLIIDIIEN